MNSPSLQGVPTGHIALADLRTLIDADKYIIRSSALLTLQINKAYFKEVPALSCNVVRERKCIVEGRPLLTAKFGSRQTALGAV